MKAEVGMKIKFFLSAISMIIQIVTNAIGHTNAVSIYKIKHDAMWPRLWIFDESAKVNMNILKAWALGMTGKGVVIALVDDGLQFDHPELQHNYDSKASFDFLDRDRDPSPEKLYSHGTRLAGIIAAKGNNTKCGVGIAHHAKIGGIRMLAPHGITAATEASSLAFSKDYIDIYSVSWGPGDDGIKVGKPPFLTKWVLEKGAMQGRKGKGNLFVWASGNGGNFGDHCGSDGYNNSPYTISVAGAAANGRVPWYSERCASILTSAITSKTHSHILRDYDLFTTEANSKCVGTVGATSTAVPMIASIIALGLQINPNLSWRDVQYLIIASSKSDHLISNDWAKNGIGRSFSHWFGYGVLDAEKFVRNSARHRPLPKQEKCSTDYFTKNYVLSGYRRISKFKIKPNKCSVKIRHVEHVILKMTIAYRQRGMVTLKIKSPMGTESIVLGTRKRDLYYLSYIDWDFLSVHFWGERLIGTWEVSVLLLGRRENRGRIYSGKLIFTGTK